jgi:hypothetical protein
MVASNDPTPGSTVPRDPTGPGCAWTIGLVLGGIAAIGLLSFGVYGVGFTLLALALIAWKGPRAIAAAGLVTGLGGTWAFLFGRVMVSCAIENADTPGSCDAGNIGLWVVGSAGILVVGVAMSIVIARRAR